MKPTAMVLSCLGGEMSALGVVRSLGREGVPVVVLAEGDNPELASSRYVQRYIVEPEFLNQPAHGIELLKRLAATYDERPALFPTADPDTLFVGHYLQSLQDAFAVISPPHELVEMLLDKGEFYAAAKRHGFPIPRTEEPGDAEQLQQIANDLNYPVALKPKFTSSWGDEAILEIVDHKKALRIDSAESLLDYYRQISQHNSDLLIQEFVVGEDDAHWECHVFVAADGQCLGSLTGQKIRLYPTFAGGGCYVNSQYQPELHRLSRHILQQLNFTGLANVDFKQDARTGEFLLFEVNPRVSHWSVLDAACGLNLAYMAYAEGCGLAYDKTDRRQKENIRYIFFEQDIRSFFDYKAHGKWGLLAFVRSYFFAPKVFQVFAWDDPKPALEVFKRLFFSVLKKLSRR